MKVAVCVITYLRPEGLKRLMEGLNRLTFDKCGEVPRLELIVVDNDSSGLACAFCEEMRPDLRWPLRCFIEPRRGIPFARNTAVARARKQEVDFVAFIDDDEVPEPSWLDELSYVQRSYGADVVTGPALPHFTVPVAPWMDKGEFFESARLPTGHPMEWASTRNALVRSEVFEKMDKLFDERFGLSGGSDRHFFERVHRAGYKIVWADEALVYEWIPQGRARLRWLLQRRFRHGNQYSLRSVEFEPSMAVRAALVMEAGRLIVGGLSRLLPRLPRSLALERRPVKIRKRQSQNLAVEHRPPVEIRKLRSPIKVVLRSPIKVIRRRQLVKPLLRISRGAGILVGAVGKRYEEYRKTHGV